MALLEILTTLTLSGQRQENNSEGVAIEEIVKPGKRRRSQSHINILKPKILISLETKALIKV